jgi:hypothetical protein
MYEVVWAKVIAQSDRAKQFDGFDAHRDLRSGAPFAHATMVWR